MKKRVVKVSKLISVMASLFAIVGCKEKMVELQTDLPPASIYRNKKHYNSSGEALLVPEDTKLLSRGAEVTTIVIMSYLVNPKRLLTVIQNKSSITTRSR